MARPQTPSAVSLRDLGSADRRRVLDTALGPQFVQTAFDFERRAQSDVPLEQLAVVADLFHDADGPVLGQAELLAEIAFGSDKSLDFRIGRFQRLIESSWMKY